MPAPMLDRLHRRIELRSKGTTSSGQVRLLKDLDTGIEGRDVVIVEDIVDTGLDADLSAGYSARAVAAQPADGLPPEQAVASPGAGEGGLRRVQIEDRFVVGYGLDYAEHHRNLPYIAVMNEPV